MASRRAELARLESDLLEARQLEDGLQYEHAVATHTSHPSRATEIIDLELARAQATIAELEDRREELTTPAAVAPAPAPASPVAASAAPAPPGRRFLTTAEMAERLGLTRKGLERMRSEKRGPAWIKVGGSVRYPVND